MKKFHLTVAAALGLSLGAGFAQAQQEAQDDQSQQQGPTPQERAEAQRVAAASTLNELLDMVKKGQTEDNREHQQRLNEFRQKAAEQDRLLKEAQDKRTAEEQRSEQLESQFEDNERLISDVQAQLDERLGTLRELFGVLQTVSGDARSTFESSLTNIEYPDRSKFLTEFAQKMGSSSKLPSIAEIERLWFELQQEATEQGKVKRLPNFRVVTADGEEVNEDIVRVGVFNVVADGKYLRHNIDTNSVSELQRQPSQGRFTNSTAALLSAQPGDGFVRFGIDITRGQLLAALVDTPDLRERIDQGGTIGYITIALGIFGVLLAIERLITLGIAGRKVKAQLKRETPSDNNALGRVLKVYQENPSADTETLELKLGEAILKETPSLQRGILFIKIISVVAPLLGLLGTVVGMIQTFQAITLYGTGDPKIMAGGISQALMTTVIGLCVAIPTVLLHTFVNGRSRNIIQILQEQSAGIVARQAEKTGQG
jgi:biopolymer transport protein ExbB